MAERVKLARTVRVGAADPETGDVIETVELDLAGALTPRALAAERARMAEAAKANSSVDYLIKPQERTLRRGRWRPKNWRQILEAIDRFRHYRQLLKRTPEVRGKTHVAAFRLGYLIAEAEAVSRWPVVKDGRWRSASRPRARHEQARAQKAAVDKIANRVSKIRADVAKTGRKLSEAAAVRIYLAKTSPQSWPKLNSAKQAAMTDNIQKRLRRARKAAK